MARKSVSQNDTDTNGSVTNDARDAVPLPPEGCSKAQRLEYLCDLAMQVGGWEPSRTCHRLAAHWNIDERTVRNNYSDALAIIRKGLGESVADIRNRCMTDLRIIKQRAIRDGDYKAANQAIQIEAKLVAADKRPEMSDTERDPDSMTQAEQAAELREMASELEGDTAPGMH